MVYEAHYDDAARRWVIVDAHTRQLSLSPCTNEGAARDLAWAMNKAHAERLAAESNGQ